MMPLLYLTHTRFTQLLPMTWCATAEVHVRPPLRGEHSWRQSLKPSYNQMAHISAEAWHKYQWQYCLIADAPLQADATYTERQRQRRGVRLLLTALLNTLGRHETVDESAFPYRLNHSRFYVCFSHTSAKLHNMPPVGRPTLSSTVAVGIIACRPIGIDVESNQVAWHVVQRFYSNEETLLLQGLPSQQRDAISRLLWQIKESFIKVYQYTLAQGLGVSYAHLIAKLMIVCEQRSPMLLITDHRSSYQIAIFSVPQTVIVF